MSSKKKYTLFSASDSGKPSPCAFFASPAGCRNGDKCKFLHEKISSSSDSQMKSNPKRDRSPSVVSSESEDESDSSMSAPAASPQKRAVIKKKADSISKNVSVKKKADSIAEDINSAKKKEPKKKKSRRSGDSDIFAKPSELSAPTPEPSRLAKKARKSEGNARPITSPPKVLANEASSSILAKTPKSTSNPNSAKKAKKNETSIRTPDFRQLSLPISSFSIPGFEHMTSITDAGPASPAKNMRVDKELSTLPLPKSTPTGRKWLDTVVKTREHPRHDTAYNFQKMIAQDAANGSARSSDWIKAKPFGDWCKNNPQAIAIDCEMCETKDPVTGSKNHRALCRISIVNADDTSDVLLDTLVKPSWPVSDYRTWVNGIEKKHLENVQFTMRHAQAFMMALCSEETVIIGHAVNNDLAAMRMEHYCNVDSSFLFSVKDEPGATPSLKDVTKAELKEDMPKTHDSVNDAVMSLRCLEAWLEKDGNVDPVERSSQKKNKNASSQLFLHRIPKICKSSHLETMFLNHTSIQPVNIDEFDFNGENGKTVVTFASARHANLAFSTLEGEEDPDASGRLQKKVFLRSGGYMRVRKMVHEKGNKRQSGEGAGSAKEGK